MLQAWKNHLAREKLLSLKGFSDLPLIFNCSSILIQNQVTVLIRH